MIIAILFGCLVGFILAIPPGPIGMASIRMGIRDGWSATLKLALGAGLFDVIYCALAMLASAAIKTYFEGIETSYPLIAIGLQILIAIAMVIFGVIMFREPPPAEADKPKHMRGEKVVSLAEGHGPFFIGIGFAVANLANPTFIPTLAAITTFVRAQEIYTANVASDIFFAIGFGAGNMLWLATLVKLVLKFRDRMTPTLLKRIQQGSGVTLIGFGAFYGIRIIVTRWDDISRALFTA
ncbi:MAG: LysE family transporter [bacterium]|nr:LysE family transporter [bacterium]